MLRGKTKVSAGQVFVHFIAIDPTKFRNSKHLGYPTVAADSYILRYAFGLFSDVSFTV